MPKNIPSLKPKELIKILRQHGCVFHRQEKGDHELYFRMLENKKELFRLIQERMNFHRLMFSEF